MGYIQLQSVKDAGLVITNNRPSDPEIQASIDLWSGFVDRATRQWFDPRSLTLVLDGTGSDTLFLPVPVISVDAVYANGDATALDPSQFQTYNSRNLPDDRKNPKIVMNGARYRDVFLPLQRRLGMGFAQGRRNQRVVGTFGYVEPDGSTPLLIERAVLRLVMLNVGRSSFRQSITLGGGWITGESTDGHSVQYGFPNTKAGTMGLTRDAEVETIIQMFKGPIVLAAPGGRGAGAWWNLG